MTPHNETEGKAASMATHGHVLEDIFHAGQHLRMVEGDTPSYSRFRAQESALVSVADHENPDAIGPLRVLVPYYKDAPLGAVSYLVSANQRRPSARNRYARIDLVIAARAHQGGGLGRLLLAGVMTHLLRTEGDMLYSITCLAAHPAIAKMLEEYGFEGQPRSDLNYTIETLKLEGVDTPALEARLAAQTGVALKRVQYMMRQSEGKGQ